RPPGDLNLLPEEPGRNASSSGILVGKESDHPASAKFIADLIRGFLLEQHFDTEIALHQADDPILEEPVALPLHDHRGGDVQESRHQGQFCEAPQVCADENHPAAQTVRVLEDLAILDLESRSPPTNHLGHFGNVKAERPEYATRKT